MKTDNLFTIDFGETNIKIVDTQFKNSVFEIKNMGITDNDPLFYFSDQESVIAKTTSNIKTLIKQLKIIDRDVRLVIPDTFSYSNFIEMPDVNEKELLSTVKYQADQFIPLPLEQVNIDIEIIFKNPKTKKLLALLSAAPKKTIAKITGLCERLGIYPDSLETETSATARFIHNLFRTKTPSADKNSGFVILKLVLIFLIKSSKSI